MYTKNIWQGGIGDAVLDAVSSYRNMIVRKLDVNAVPRSGPPAALLEMFGISASNIVKAVNDVIKLYTVPIMYITLINRVSRAAYRIMFMIKFYLIIVNIYESIFCLQ